MGSSTLALLSDSEFPQGLTRQLSRLDRMVTLAIANAELSSCCFESPESSFGRCDGGFACSEKATVHHLASGLEYCGGHFAGVDRG
jgi:hypothetical protein